MGALDSERSPAIREGVRVYREWMDAHDLWDGFSPFEQDVRDLVERLFGVWVDTLPNTFRPASRGNRRDGY